MKLQQVNLKLQPFEFEKADYIRQTFRVSLNKLFRFCWSSQITIDKLYELAQQYNKENKNDNVINYEWLAKNKIYFI